MDQLFTLPWFVSVVVVGVIVSVFAAYFKEFLDRVRSKISTRFRLAYSSSQEKENEEIKRLSKSPSSIESTESSAYRDQLESIFSLVMTIIFYGASQLVSEIDSTRIFTGLLILLAGLSLRSAFSFRLSSQKLYKRAQSARVMASVDEMIKGMFPPSSSPTSGR